MLILDANVILRFILKDISEQAVVARDLLENKACVIPVEITAEVVYVLQKVYGLERKVIAERISGVMAISERLFEQSEIIAEALKVYMAAKNLSFVDCLLVSYSKIKKHAVFTFDKELKKQLAN
ncbi:putative PIN domain protein [Candidatus Termititenax aidoneus]|uniref:PIN domain protein n=1 Tax=Termititenax aidoneus TaxID=2218524 RepID=A0A388T8F8_TERA1|nr:putative PIN domain protein [Candidatus Termititenax aidoneus]